MKRLARMASLVSVVAVFGLPAAAPAQPPNLACEGLTTAHSASGLSTSVHLGS